MIEIKDGLIDIPDPRQARLPLPLTAEEVEQRRLESEERKRLLSEFSESFELMDADFDNIASSMGLRKLKSSGMSISVYVDMTYVEGSLPSNIWSGSRLDDNNPQLERYEIGRSIGEKDRFLSALKGMYLLYQNEVGLMLARRNGVAGFIDYAKEKMLGD